MLQLHLDQFISASCMNLHPLMSDGAVPMLGPRPYTPLFVIIAAGKDCEVAYRQKQKQEEVQEENS